MNFTFKSTNNKLPKAGSSINAQFNINKMMEDKGFDVKNYLNFIEKKMKERKKNKKLNIIKSTSQFTTFKKPETIKYESCVTNTFDNTPSLTKRFKKSRSSFSTDLSRKNFLSTASNGYIKYKNYNEYRTENNQYYNFPTAKGSTQLIYDKNYKTKYSSTESNQNFNLYKTIKEIKTSSSHFFPKIIPKKNTSKKNILLTNILNENKNREKTERTPLVYDKDYIDIVFDSKRVINDYNMRKGLEMETSDNLYSFPRRKNEISVKNLLINLINNESKKLGIKEKDLVTSHKLNENLLNNNLKEFEEFKDEHKIVCKKIESSFDQLKKENNLLIDEYIVYSTISKNYSDEIQKILNQIETLRSYAFFIHDTLEKDVSRYADDIFPDYRTEKLNEYEKRMGKIINFVIKNYSIFYDPKYNQELNNELKFLEEPDYLLQKFDELDRNIIRLLKLKDNIIKETTNNENEHKIIIDELKSKYEKEEKTYKDILSEINIEKNIINSYIKKENEYKDEIFQLIGVLFTNIVEVFGKKEKNNLKYLLVINNNLDKDNVDICIKEGERILREQETLLNETLQTIKSYKENDEKFFDIIVEEAKVKKKLEKQMEFKINKKAKEKEIENKVIHKANKLNFISRRKVAIPYRSPKKKEIKKVIDHDLIRRLEDDEELLKYK